MQPLWGNDKFCSAPAHMASPSQGRTIRENRLLRFDYELLNLNFTLLYPYRSGVSAANVDEDRMVRSARTPAVQAFGRTKQ